VINSDEFEVLYNGGKFLTKWVTVSLSRRTQLSGIW